MRSLMESIYPNLATFFFLILGSMAVSRLKERKLMATNVAERARPVGTSHHCQTSR
jgi:hypothetical protein